MTSNGGKVEKVVIVGAGQAGLNAAHCLRRRGFAGRIELIGEEPWPPYQRPPLSKAFLKSELEESRLFFRPERFYADHDIELKLSVAARDIDAGARKIRCDDGATVRYDRLILATGARPIRIPIEGANLPGVFELRGLDDSKAIRDALAGAGHVVVVGGGYIGLEVASAARQLGHEVTVVERLPRLLSRVTSPAVSEFYLDLHREHGVEVRLEDTVEAVLGQDAVTGVRLASGVSVDAELVLIGVGVRPADGIAEKAGVECDDGILVDRNGRTSDRHIYAAGDCARHRLADGDTLRLESVHNALDQSERIAAAIVGDEPPAYDPPWFWSDQYDIKLQTVGLFDPDDETLVRGDVAAKRFSVLYFRADELVAVDAVNDPATFLAGKQILKKGIVAHRDELADAETSLKSYVKRAAEHPTA